MGFLFSIFLCQSTIRSHVRTKLFPQQLEKLGVLPIKLRGGFGATARNLGPGSARLNTVVVSRRFRPQKKLQMQSFKKFHWTVSLVPSENKKFSAKLFLMKVAKKNLKSRKRVQMNVSEKFQVSTEIPMKVPSEGFRSERFQVDGFKKCSK